MRGGQRSRISVRIITAEPNMRVTAADPRVAAR